jgi:hypothetical protein
MRVNLEHLETLPSFVGMRLSVLKTFGGTLDSTWDIHGEEMNGDSRSAGHSCRKDWQINGCHGPDMRRVRRQIRAMKGALCDAQ